VIEITFPGEDGAINPLQFLRRVCIMENESLRVLRNV
jgi:hypothetical protein